MAFSVGLLTSEKANLPSWADMNVFYAKGSLGWSYADNGYSRGYSLASISVGVVDMTFHAPKWFSFLPDDYLINPNHYFGVGTWHAGASLGAGVSAYAEIISGTIGLQFGDVLSFSIKGYVGADFTFDLTNGLKIGAGAPLGVEIAISIDWWALFH